MTADTPKGLDVETLIAELRELSQMLKHYLFTAPGELCNRAADVLHAASAQLAHVTQERDMMKVERDDWEARFWACDRAGVRDHLVMADKLEAAEADCATLRAAQEQPEAVRHNLCPNGDEDEHGGIDIPMMTLTRQLSDVAGLQMVYTCPKCQIEVSVNFPPASPDPGWRTIASAPKDRGFLFAYNALRKVYGLVCWWPGGGFNGEGCWGWNDESIAWSRERGNQPTHWYQFIDGASLPPPPPPQEPQ